MLVSSTYYASRFLAIGVASYCATLFFNFINARSQFSGRFVDLRGASPLVRFGRFYIYWLYLPLSILGLLGASMFVALAIEPAPNTHFTNLDTSILKFHIGVPIATGVLSFLCAIPLILTDDWQHGPDAILCGIASGAYGLAAPLAFQIVGKLFSNNSDVVMTEIACLSLAPVILRFLLWGRSGATY